MKPGDLPSPVANRRPARRGSALRCAMRWAVPAALVIALIGFGGYGVAYMLVNAPFRDELPFASTFESGDLREWDSWGARQLCCEHSARVTAESPRAGRQAVRVTLRRDDPRIRGSKRAEFRLSGAAMGEEYWYGFSILLPADWQASAVPVTPVQWHAVPDVMLLELGQSPPLRIMIINDEWRIESRWDPARVSRAFWGQSDRIGEATLWTAPLDRGRWTDWVFRVKWSYREDGIVEVWKDGAQIVGHRGPNTFNDWIAPYLKVGVYVPAWSVPDQADVTTERSIVFDEIRARRGPGAPSDVSPRQ